MTFALVIFEIFWIKSGFKSKFAAIARAVIGSGVVVKGE